MPKWIRPRSAAFSGHGHASFAIDNLKEFPAAARVGSTLARPVVCDKKGARRDGNSCFATNLLEIATKRERTRVNAKKIGQRLLVGSGVIVRPERYRPEKHEVCFG